MCSGALHLEAYSTYIGKLTSLPWTLGIGAYTTEGFDLAAIGASGPYFTPLT